MGLALYRKYRSKSLDDIVGQDHIKQVLNTALKTNTIRHAYLFTGPRGVGKTSIARILAHEINQLPYDEESTHLDIIEIDAASNRRIDEIRELRDKVHITPTTSKYKVYIIDEVHMLTKEAFNALLKTLEEPPEHVIFILATTEAHKVPDTILSRTQRFTFHPVPKAEAVAHLAAIAKKEGIQIDNASLERIVDHAQGSLRDSLNMLDQMTSAGDSLNVDTVTDILGIPDTQTVASLVSATIDHNPQQVIKLLEQSRVDGHNAPTLASHISKHVRQLIVDGQADDKQIIDLLEKLLQIPQSPQPFMALELALLSYATKPSAATVPKAIIKQNEYTKLEQSSEMTNQLNEDLPPPDESPQEPTPPSTAPASTATADPWDALLLDVKNSHNTLYSVLRMAQPSLDNDELLLTFAFGFHQKQVEGTTQKKIITTAASNAYGKKMHIKTAVANGKNAPKSAPTKTAETIKKPQSGHLKDVSNIFEGAELLE